MTTRGIPTTVLVAPDAFKGTLSATDVATAIGRGLERAGIHTDLCPIADGGEGTLDALVDAVGAEICMASARIPTTATPQLSSKAAGGRSSSLRIIPSTQPLTV